VRCKEQEEERENGMEVARARNGEGKPTVSSRPGQASGSQGAPAQMGTKYVAGQNGEPRVAKKIARRSAVTHKRIRHYERAVRPSTDGALLVLGRRNASVSSSV
jgi:hypothetical protein